MKDISIYFSNFGQNSNYKKNQIGGYVQYCSLHNFLGFEPNSIALIFVPEYRNSNLNENQDWVEQFRKQFYTHFIGAWKVDVYDLGVIKPGEKIEDTYKAVKEVVAELIKNDVIPLIIGGSQDLTYPIYQSYESLEQTINILSVDAALDLGDVDAEIDSESWLNKIVLHKPNYLFNYSLFGYQSYLADPEELELLDQLHFDKLRLGEFYSDEKKAEPLLRNTDLLSFDLNAIRSSDFKGNSCFLPNGLYGEDACRIMRYAGMSDKLTSLGIFNLTGNSTELLNDLNLVSQMLWYFIEGVSLRKKDYPIGSKVSYLKYKVSLDNFKDEIIFFKSDKSGRWWMQVPYPSKQGVKYQRHLLVPCNYSDYQDALKNELPDLWLRTYKKLS